MMDAAQSGTGEVPWITRYRTALALGIASVILGAGSVVSLICVLSVREPIRFSSSGTGPSGVSRKTITVDIAGAVKRPGVYTLPDGSRIADAITAGGGFTAGADEEYIARTLNRASFLKDGAKIYIPIPSFSGMRGNPTPGQNSPVVSSQPVVGLVNVNTGTISDLDTLPGVGPVTADRIVANRPYQTAEELVTKGALSRSILEKIRDRISL